MKVWVRGLRICSIALSCLFVAMTIVASAADLPRMKPEDLKKLIETNASGVVILDAQPRDAYEMGHITGAVNLPWAPDVEGLGALPKDKTLVVYCDCAHEEDSSDLAEQLMRKFGYKDVKLLEGGWARWRELGYPCEFKK